MEDRGVGVCAVSLILGLIALVLVVFRFYTRFGVIHKPGWDDFFIALSLVSVSEARGRRPMYLHIILTRGYRFALLPAQA